KSSTLLRLVMRGLTRSTPRSCPPVRTSACCQACSPRSRWSRPRSQTPSWSRVRRSYSRERPRWYLSTTTAKPVNARCRRGCLTPRQSKWSRGSRLANRWGPPDFDSTSFSAALLVRSAREENTRHDSDPVGRGPTPDSADGAARPGDHGRRRVHVPEDRSSAAHQHPVRERLDELPGRYGPG